MKTVLFVSHKKSQCGVYVPSLHVTNALALSDRYQFIRAECESLSELLDAVALHSPAAIIYNYMHVLFPWMADGGFKHNMSPHIIQIGIAHDSTSPLFDYNIMLDPTFPKESGDVYGIGRLIPEYDNTFTAPAKLTVGSFGFGTPGKGFERIVPLVESEFAEAIVRINIPSADFGDKDGCVARGIAARCQAQVTKPGIELTVTHHYWDDMNLLDFLANNTVNVFLYEDMGIRGISSVIDMALAAQRPIAISDSTMFRHMMDVRPSICVTRDTTLRTVIGNGIAPLKAHRDEWSVENFIRGYEYIMDSIFAKEGG